MLGKLTKALNPAKLIGGLANKVLGPKLGGIVGGLANFAMNGFNPMNMAMNMFKGLMGGAGANPLQGLLGQIGGVAQGLLPQLPQMGGGMQTGGVGGGTGIQTGGAGAGLNGVETNMLDRLNQGQADINNMMKNLNPDNPGDMLKMQDAMQKQQQLFQMLTNISKKKHEIAMSMLRNL